MKRQRSKPLSAYERAILWAGKIVQKQIRDDAETQKVCTELWHKLNRKEQ